MRSIWHLLADMDFQFTSTRWLKDLLEFVPKSMVDYIILTAWRAWYARNEVTHAKLLPTIEGSKRILSGYVKILRNLKEASSDEIIKRKQPVLISMASDPRMAQLKKPPDNVWAKPPAGWVKLNCDGYV